MTFIFFNLLVNSVLSLLAGLLLINFFLWLFRVETGRWKILLLSLPFVKIVYDFVRGVPEHSILFSGIDPFSLPPRHQMLTIRSGIDGWTPFLNTVFSVNSPDGKTFNSSVGDYLLFWIHRNFGNEMLLIIVSVAAAVSLTLLSLRLLQYYRFEKIRCADRLKAESLSKIKIGRRMVDVYKSSDFSGTPFTGGVLHPYICIPSDAYIKLTSEELDAVVAHELGHVRYYDLIVTVSIQVLGDLFWFIPGYRWLSRKIDRLREVVADQWATSHNVDPHFLASALLKLKEIPEGREKLVLYSAFFREKSLLKERVQRLLGDLKEKSPRFGWQNIWFRYAITVLIAALVLNSVLGGNFSNQKTVWLKHHENFIICEAEALA